MTAAAPTVREMIAQAAQALEEPFRNADIREWILAKWPGTHDQTIQCHIIICTVNQQSRVNWQQNSAPRVANDERYDLLYRLERGQRVRYEAELHGAWRIARTPDGALIVACDDEMPVIEPAPKAAAASPIMQSQIDAANRLLLQLPTWQATERGFERLRIEFPGFDLPAVLMKAAAVNDLYSTRVYAIWRMAAHIAEVGPNLPQDPVEAVLMIGRLPGGAGGTHRSFASKYCHFFIDPERFPIYDSYCEQMVRHHLGSEEAVGRDGDAFAAFKTNIDRLRELSGIEASYRELDRYLWLAGQYRDWLGRRDEAQINSELRGLFEAPPSDEAAEALAALLPDESVQS